MKVAPTGTSGEQGLDEPLASCYGIGEARAKLLAKLDLKTRVDLLFHVPKRYEDRTRYTLPSQAEEGAWLTLHAVVKQARASRWRGGRQVFEVVLETVNTGSSPETVRATWFNGWYAQKALPQGTEAVFFGKLIRGKQGLALYHPEFERVEHDQEEFIHLNRLTPIYPLTEGITQRVMRRLMFEQTQRRPLQELTESFPVPDGLMALRDAVQAVHFPSSWAEQQRARARLVFDEFFLQQCLLAQRRRQRARLKKTRRPVTGDLSREFLAQLPFAPTGAQARAMREIDTDLAVETPMNRLLQGDVGAGKTLVAVHAMLRAVERGEHAALMAPTEILAEQHFLNLRRWLDPLEISVGMHTASRKSTDRSPMDSDAVQRQLFNGRGAVTVGTHALLYDSFQAGRLGLVVIDEQHKFGVRQRLALSQKGTAPDVLVMTATPIPRTLAMTIYGDLDVSVLDELPPGRGKIVTACRAESDLPKVWDFMQRELAAGRQAYVVYPLIEESEKVEAKAVQAEHQRLCALFPSLKVGLLHGRMRPEEKERVMREFRANQIQLLVSTPVIEVGVDVPNATLMVIENAERFGLAQLHQLRGRIGRGGNKSYCVLVGEPKSEESWRRLKVMEETTDGFRIAEEDLKIRGPGDILGTDQSGLPPLRFGDPLADIELLRQARAHAERLLNADPTLAQHPELKALLGGEGSRRRQTLATVS